MDGSRSTFAGGLRRNTVARWVIGAALSSACTGAIDAQPLPDPGQPAKADPRVPPSRPKPDMVDTGPVNPACGSKSLPGPPVLRRLTNAEYDRALAALFGQASDRGKAFPADAPILGFDNNVASLTMSDERAAAYRDAAIAVAQEATRDATRLRALVGCDPGETACLRGFVERFGRRVYRRPLEPDEIADLIALAEKGTDATAGVGLAIQALLQSPFFLFRVEVGVPDAARPGWNKLPGYALATRLSFTLLGAPPSDALLDSAQRGELETLDGIERVARAMLATPQGTTALRLFGGQWLHLREVAAVEPDAAHYPRYDKALNAAMREETERLFEAYASGARGSFLDILTTNRSFLTPALAAHYGVPAPATPWTEVTFDAAANRGGLLTQASILALTAIEEGAAVIHRGKFVRDVLLCEPTPPLPDDVPPLPEPDPRLSERERLAKHREGACQGCHQRLDPVGFGLERYDVVGRHRLKDASGFALTGKGQLFGFPDPDFTGPFELAARLRQAPETAACVVTQVFRYASGRLETEADACLLGELSKRFADSGHRFPELLVALAKSDSFRYVTAGGSP